MPTVNFNPPTLGQITDDPRYNERNGLTLALGAPFNLVPSGTPGNPLFVDAFGTVVFPNGLKPSSFGVGQGNNFWYGSGVPANASGANGDLYVRTDTPGTANQRLYMRSAGAWVALVV